MLSVNLCAFCFVLLSFLYLTCSYGLLNLPCIGLEHIVASQLYFDCTMFVLFMNQKQFDFKMISAGLILATTLV